MTSKEEALGDNYYYRATLKEIYTGDDISKESEISVDDTPFKFVFINSPATEIGNGVIDVAEGVFNFVTDVVPGVIGGIKDIKDNLQKNLVGTLITWVLDILKFFADLLQMLANSFQTGNLGTAKDWTITYSADYLYTDGAGQIDDEGSGNRDMYTRVTEYTASSSDETEIEESESTEEQPSEKENNKKTNTIEVDGEKEGFTRDTPIPVIPGELYYVSLGEIELLDINFLTVDEELHRDDQSIWRKLRDFVSAVIHITIYISAAILVITLIVQGIRIVAHTYDNPAGRAEEIEGLQRFAVSLLMLISTVIIMAISIFGSKAFFDDIKKGDSNEGPIRVNVKSAEYSFSTTVTGYFRYMSEIEDVDRYVEKAIYTGGYIVLVLVNLAVIIFMFLRMIGMMVLAIIGPIIAALNAFHIQGGMNYRTWVELYVRLALVQVIMAIIYRIILNCTI